MSKPFGWIMWGSKSVASSREIQVKFTSRLKPYVVTTILTHPHNMACAIDQSRVKYEFHSNQSSLLLVTYRWHSLVCCHTLGSSSSMKNWRLKNAGLDLTLGGFFLGWSLKKKCLNIFTRKHFSPLSMLPCIYISENNILMFSTMFRQKCSYVPFRHSSTLRKWELFQKHL